MGQGTLSSSEGFGGTSQVMPGIALWHALLEAIMLGSKTLSQRLRHVKGLVR